MLQESTEPSATVPAKAIAFFICTATVVTVKLYISKLYYGNIVILSKEFVKTTLPSVLYLSLR